MTRDNWTDNSVELDYMITDGDGNPLNDTYKSWWNFAITSDKVTIWGTPEDGDDNFQYIWIIAMDEVGGEGEMLLFIGVLSPEYNEDAFIDEVKLYTD